MKYKKSLIGVWNVILLLTIAAGGGIIPGIAGGGPRITGAPGAPEEQ